MFSKRELCAKTTATLGLTSLLERCPRRCALLVLIYHRIGKWRETPYNQDIFSADAEAFADQLSLLKKKTTVVSLEEALSILFTPRPFRGTVVLLTFDDGYIDNYRIAFPILRAARVPATFFLVPSFMGSSEPPWWDELALRVRNLAAHQITLEDQVPHRFELGTGRRTPSIRLIEEFCRNSLILANIMDQIRDRCAKDGQLPFPVDRLFLNWEEAGEMAAHGMSIGAHTLWHSCLSRLSPEAQEKELSSSRRELEAKLDTNVDVLAYPYGGQDSFDANTMAAAQNAGYRAAFSDYGGINCPGNTERYNILRANVDWSVSLSRLRFRLATAPLVRNGWF